MFDRRRIYYTGQELNMRVRCRLFESNDEALVCIQ
jgi:hypothetical protein